MALDLFLSLCKGKHKREKCALSALGHLLIPISLCWRMSFKQEVILGRHTLCHDQMLLNTRIYPVLLHGWLMFLLWKHWGPCEISEVRWYGDNDNLGIIDCAVNWVNGTICAMSECKLEQYPVRFRKTSKILLPVSNLNKLRKKMLQGWTAFFCARHVSSAYKAEHQASKLRVYWISVHFCGETELVSLLIEILWANEEIQIKLL